MIFRINVIIAAVPRYNESSISSCNNAGSVRPIGKTVIGGCSEIGFLPQDLGRNGNLCNGAGVNGTHYHEYVEDNDTVIHEKLKDCGVSSINRKQ